MARPLKHSHADADLELRELLSKPEADISHKSSWFSRYRITKQECKTYWYSGTCVRCARLQLGDKRTTTNHSEPCRERLYK